MNKIEHLRHNFVLTFFIYSVLFVRLKEKRKSEREKKVKVNLTAAFQIIFFAVFSVPMLMFILVS